MPQHRRTLVFGPAYLDRVLRVDRPLIDPAVGGTLDRSVQGRGGFEGVRQQIGEAGPSSPDPLNLNGGTTTTPSSSLLLHCIPDFDLIVNLLPRDWPGPNGVIWNVDHRSLDERGRTTREVAGIDWQDDLGGMGAGFAKAFGGELFWLAGDEGDTTSATVARLLDREGVVHRPIHVADHHGEWTLLITSGEHGDKLAVGIRTLADATVAFDSIRDEPCQLIVAASMNNKRAASALKGKYAQVKLFAPSLRNMMDTDPKVSQFAKNIDILCCNRLEWESLENREEVAWRLSILVVTDGPRGALIRFTDESGDAGAVEVPAFSRLHPPVDTNRAGEAFASTLVTTLLDQGWMPGVSSASMIRQAAERASAASALVLDRADFGFATSKEIDEAIRRGVVG